LGIFNSDGLVVKYMVFLGNLIFIKGGLEMIKQVERKVEDRNNWLWIKNAPSS